MNHSDSPATLRPFAIIVCCLALAASTLLLSAAQLESPQRSGYGVDEQAVERTSTATSVR